MQKTVRIVIIEDDEILQHAYKQLIEDEPGFYVVNCYNSFEAAEKKLVAEDPSIVLLDIELPGISGVNAIPLVKKMLPKAHVIVLTVYELEDQIFSALANGAAGYLTKDTSSAKIIEAIYDARGGGGPMSKKIASIVIKSFQKNSDSPLSKRETEIMRMVSEGKKRNEIAEELFIELETVKTHIKNIYAKLNVNSRSDALKVLKQHRVI
ncbi:response regulator transcription factor [Mucilaginibacter sp. L3T2-6]|uniref:response regulator n=1 Tax=Mucilaginibacter sp. L3T2-6 TaxID=3062491 RepID=UPI002674A5EC|nr:response regulator transcription factor [Mucilaginibacter sp. L3T2-6]MDO3642059.1 response regulator transcription factor [Mucilaginibacter sp. L3T2-6]MDV6214553.1 response regulator transcription factor [Mucilaginibacter sp. L3T2-6]